MSLTSVESMIFMTTLCTEDDTSNCNWMWLGVTLISVIAPIVLWAFKSKIEDLNEYSEDQAECESIIKQEDTPN